MVSVAYPATPATPDRRATRSCTLVSRCALVSSTSPLLVCQPGGVGQCAQLGFAMRRHHELHRQCFASVSQSATRRWTHNPAARDRKCRRQAAQSCRAPSPYVGAWRGWQGAQHHCFPVRQVLLPQSVGKAGTPCQAHTHRLACASCRTATRGGGGTRPLRPPASLLHKAALPSVPSSHCAKAPFGASHRWRALRVKATGLMQSGLRWRWWLSWRCGIGQLRRKCSSR